MKILSSVLNCIFLFAVFFSFLLNLRIPVQAWDNSSTNTQFQQSILPVRFIYLDENGNIIKIFNNVSELNTVYILKFYNDKTGVELPITKDLLDKFQILIDKVDMLQQGFFYTASLTQKQAQTITPHIELLNSPQGLQEIHTIL